MRQEARWLCFAAALLLAGSCAHMTVPDGGPSSKGTNCPGANPQRNGPIVCIDANTLAANPDHVHVRQGAWIHFYLSDVNQELDIDFAGVERAKVEHKGQRGNECWLRVKDDAPLGHAKYTAINVTTGNRKDPDILIDPAN